MKSRFTILIALLLLALPVWADAPPRGKERLRELAVFPDITLQFGYEYKSGWDGFWLGNALTLPGDLREIREKLKERPSDIDLKLQLAFLLEECGQTNEARICNLEIEKLCRRRLETWPDDGWVMVQLSQALENVDQPGEAESLLRRSVVVSSNDWRCWEHLGIDLAGHATKLLFPSVSLNGNAPPTLDMEALGAFHPSAEATKQFEELQREATCCMEKAQASGKNESLFWEKRAEYSGSVALGNLIQKCQRGDPVKVPGAQYMATWSRSYVEDLRQAASRRPDDVKLICLAGYAEWMAATSEAKAAGNANLADDFGLTDAARKSLRDAATRLESLFSKLDRTKEAAAREFHALLSAMADADAADRAIANVRRVVALDPTREQSWDMLMGLSVKSASSEEMEQLCESRLKANSSARNHLILAKQLVKEKKWDRAKTQAEAALHKEPENLIGKFMLVALTIRREAGEKLGEELKAQFTAIDKLITQLPDGPDRRERVREFLLNTAIALVLTDEPDAKSQAQLRVEDVLNHFPDDQNAKDIRAALE